GWSERTGAGELHRAEADAPHRPVTERKGVVTHEPHSTSPGPVYPTPAGGAGCSGTEPGQDLRDRRGLVTQRGPADRQLATHHVRVARLGDVRPDPQP